MPDIAMCKGEDPPQFDQLRFVAQDGRICPRRDVCYRCKATPTPRRQSYFAKIPLKPDNTNCEYFMPVEKWAPVKEE